MIRGTISHDRDDESFEAKARWFQSLTIAERLNVFESFVQLANTAALPSAPLTMDEVTARYVPTPPDRIQIVQRLPD